MAGYIVRRLIIAVPVLFLISLIGFTVLTLAPGDPILARIGPEALAHMTSEQIELARHEAGLDAPVVVRYAQWLLGVLRGDFGFSLVSGRSVSDEILPRVGPTIYLMSTAMLLSLVIGIPAGVISAVRQYTRWDYLLTALTLVMISTPIFLLGLIVIYVFGVSLNWLPVGGMYTFGVPFSPADRLAHLVMPAGIMSFAYAAPLMRYTRASMLDVLNSDYMTTARAKGLPTRTIMIRHGLRTALLPVITLVALMLPELFTGAVITEQVFAWPGLGQLAVRAANSRDPALMQGTIVLVGVGVLLSSVLADVAYALVDPRVRFAKD